MADYALIAAAVALVILGAIGLVGSHLDCEFSTISAALRGAENALCILD